jgi:hypothetical protein
MLDNLLIYQLTKGVHSNVPIYNLSDITPVERQVYALMGDNTHYDFVKLVKTANGIFYGSPSTKFGMPVGTAPFILKDYNTDSVAVSPLFKDYIDNFDYYNSLKSI